MIYSVTKVEKMDMKDGSLYKCTGFVSGVDCDNVVCVCYNKKEVKPNERYNVIFTENDNLKGIKVKLGTKIEK